LSTDPQLENAALGLAWRDGELHATNRLSGKTRRLDFPGFALRVEGRDYVASDFALENTAQEPARVTFSYRCESLGVAADVIYWLEGDKPWFRKKLVLRSSRKLSTPDRVWVDVQEGVPGPVRRVGYGLRGGLDAEEQTGLDTYSRQPGCGYPVYVDDWFAGVEHPTGFAVPGDRLGLFHHPVWDENGVIESFPAVYGAAASHAAVGAAFMDYLWDVRLPRLASPLVTVTAGWSTRALGGGEYLDSLETNEAFLKALLEVGLRPDALGLDAGYFERRSIFRHKGDDEQDTTLAAFSRLCRENGLDLSLWVSHNGRTGFDMEWIKEQGWETGEGPEATYRYGEFVVMMQPEFEEALASRFERLVGEVGARHLKIDWDNECARNGSFVARYPTADHVREASVKAFNRIDRRMRAKNPELITRNGWWPSPWWLSWADHVWLVDSGDGEYAALPSRTQRDREITHRDAMYHHILRRAETPCPLDAFDNHGFAHAVDNPFADAPHTWLDNAVLQFTRGTTYLHMAVCPEGLRQWQADMVQQALDWMHFHADELGVKGACMIGGDPAAGAVYGYLHPGEGRAWVVLRNPLPEPQTFAFVWANALGWAPRTVRQVYPFWQDLALLEGVPLLGHEVRLLELFRAPEPDASPIPGAPFMVRACDKGFEYLFPGARPLTDEIGPTVHPDMRIPELTAEKTADDVLEGGRRLQWFVGVPHRFEKAELLVTLRGSQDALDAVQVRAGCSRYRGVEARHVFSAERIHRCEARGHGTSRVLPPLGPRDRDDYVFGIPDSGWISLTVDVTGAGARSLQTDAWLTGYEASARKTVSSEKAPAEGPLLPVHPYGFARAVRG